MGLEELFSQIESREFSTWANLASVLFAFGNTVKDSEVFRELLKTLKEDTNSQPIVFNRLKHLLHLETDHKFENLDDVAIATYILALKMVGFPLPETLLDHTPNLFWADRVFQLENPSWLSAVEKDARS